MPVAGRSVSVRPVSTAPASPGTHRFGVSVAEGELPERRPGDVARVVVAAIGALIVGIWAQSQSSVDTNLASVVNGIGDGLEGFADVLLALGTLWAGLVVVVILLVVKRPRVALSVAIAGFGAWAIATVVGDILGPRTPGGLDLTIRTGDGPVYPAVAVATFSAWITTLSPYVIRPVRRAAIFVGVLVALAAIYDGIALPADVIGGWFVGVGVGALVLVALGAPGGRPSRQDVSDALSELGFDVAEVSVAPGVRRHATVMDAELTNGEQLRVHAFGRDQRDGQLASRVWRAAAYKEPKVPVFGSRIQQVEHIAYALLAAEKAHVNVPQLLRTGVAGPDAALLVTRRPAGAPLAELAAEAVTDEVLAEAWQQLVRLHEAGIAHGAVDGRHLVVGTGGAVELTDLDHSDVGGERYWRDRDVATLLMTTAHLAGNDRAIAAACQALDTEQLAAALPLIQPASLPRDSAHGEKHLAKTLKQLRADVVKATGAEDVPPLKVKRLTLVNIGMLAGILLALAIAIPGMKDVDWHTVWDEFQTATWGWAVLALVLYPLVPISWGTALMGCVNTDLPFVPTVLTQLACSFLNLITPNGIGGTALQIDYLHHRGVPVASAGSAMVLSTGVGGAIQMVLFLSAAAITATTIDSSSSGDSVTLGAIAVGAALVGVVLFIPKIRGKVVPAVKRAGTDIWAVIRNPRKGAQLFGGDLGGNLIYPALLGLCLLAFGESLDFAQLIVVQVGAGMLGSVAPVPGGIGVQEAALTAGLTSFGIDANTALATVIVFRGITFALPPVFGFFTLQYLRRSGYA
jgi:uncharacterized membrane protein YbhN (UPF0104 family)